MPRKEQYRKDPTKFQRQRREYYERNQKRARAASREWRAKHRKEHRAYQQKWYRKHRTKAKRYQKRWYEKNKQATLQRSADWAKKNPKRRIKTRQRWERTPKGQANKQKNTAKRRTRMRDAGSFTTAQWQAKLRRYANRCARCRRRCKLELHHIIPLADGGRNTIRNVLPLCEPCHVETHRELKAARHKAMRAPAPHP